MSFFRKVVQSITNSPRHVSDRLQSASSSVPADLLKLERVEKGLSKRALDYITGHGDDTVLTILAKDPKGWLAGGTDIYPGDQPGIALRREMFCMPASDPKQIIRYVHVLMADRTAASRFSFKATDAVPPAVRVYLREIHLGKTKWKSKDIPPPTVLTEHVMAVVKGIGGTAEDLFDVAFYKDKSWPRRKGVDLGDAIDLAEMSRAYPDAFIAQHKRLPIYGRLKLFEHVVNHALTSEPPFDQMILDGLGDNSKVIREDALKIFAKRDKAEREALGIKHLANGNAAMRGSMVEVLTSVDSDPARDVLKTHLEMEKTARIRGMIEDYLAVTEPAQKTDAESVPIENYPAMDGSTVAIPPLRVPQDGPLPEITDEFRAQLVALGEDLEATYQKDLKEAQEPSAGYKHKKYYLQYACSVSPQEFAEQAQRFLLGGLVAKEAPKDVFRRLLHPKSRDVFVTFLASCAPKPVLDLAITSIRGNLNEVKSYRHQNSPWVGALLAYLEEEDADYRYLELKSREYHHHHKPEVQEGVVERSRRRGDPLFHLYMMPRRWYDREEEERADAVYWPLVAENLWIVDRALGIVADPEFPETQLGGLRMLSTLPKLPAQYGPALVNIALSGAKEPRKMAHKLLDKNGGFDEHLLAMVDDTRQHVRAGAAKWLGARQTAAAVVPIQKRLKKEKSPIARAAFVFALQALGEDVSAYVGPKALLSDAEKNLPKASLAAVDWLDLSRLPAVRYRDGTSVPVEVLKWWIALAVKLKAPGEADLFDLYLDQLKPEDAQTLSTWIFDSWYVFDISPPIEDVVEQRAQGKLAAIGKYWQSYFPGPTAESDEEKLEFLRRQIRKETPNSGSASKGILALTGKMDPGHGVGKVRSYLRKHGGRTSQTTAMLELMAAMGDPMSLQVVIAAATRLRQKGVQKRANELIEAVADRNDWTMDQLADRTVPTGGLEDDGRMELSCVSGEKIYVAQLDEKLGLTLFNPDGKSVKALPSAQDDETKAAKKALSAAKKEIKQAIEFQSTRLFEAMCADRTWSFEDFSRDFAGHPLMRKLVERLIWQGLDAQGKVQGSFRPTAEGEMIDAKDAEIDPSAFAHMRLAHASTLSQDDAALWRQHMKDYEIAPLFDQVRADLPRLPEEMSAKTDIEDRMGWVTDCFTIRGEAKRAGFERGDILDSGGFDCYTRHFGGVGIVAVIAFTGSCVPEENWPAAYKTLFFERLAMGQQRGYGSGKKLRLDKVPPVMLAECWADLHKMSKKASFDPDWDKVSPW